MAVCLSKLSTAAQGCLLRRGPRVFGLLGKVTPSGLAPFTRRDVATSWALTAEFGCLRLERLSGDEEVTGQQMFLPVPSAFDYGLAGGADSADSTRAVFGVLACELEQLVTALRQGSFPVLGHAISDQRCSISGGIIPGYWPHVVISNMALHGNVLSLETFMRVVVSSIPQSRLGGRFPELQLTLKQIMRVVVMPRRGIPYTKEALALAPTPAWLR
ncbi:MAG TPA: hypothetical protein VMU04_04655 [Candidatus Acidoferrum sp.]|nr:hypothetical protein [Candidatus Acidoferrum sp.]